MTARRLMVRSLTPLGGLLATWLAVAASSSSSFTFEEAVRRSDRIVVATVESVGAGEVALPSGRKIPLGIKEAATGVVMTPYRIRITDCLLDGDGSCRPGESEVLVPGGTVYETVDGASRLRTWEVSGAAGAPLPPVGEDVLLFLARRAGRYVPLNDRGSRVRVERSPGSASVVLRFESPRFLSGAGRRSAAARAGSGNPAAARPVFMDSVPIDRLKEMIDLVRQVPMPTSGTRHAIPKGAVTDAADDVRDPGIGLRSGDDAGRRPSALAIGNDRGSPHRPGERGRA